LTEFNPVSIKMAKEQDLPLDPMKISGVCGRLQCCLAYESAQDREAKSLMPRKGQRVNTPSGVGVVVGVFPLKEAVLVEMESQAEAEFPVSQVKVTEEPPKAQPVEAEPVEAEGPESSEILETFALQPGTGQSKPQASSTKAEAPTETEAKPGIISPLKNEAPPVNPEVKNEPEAPKKEGPQS
jgi:hypothetical protein